MQYIQHMQVGKTNTEEAALKKKLSLSFVKTKIKQYKVKQKILRRVGREFRAKLVSKSTQKLSQP